MADLILEDAELTRVTGYKRKSDQMAWLKKHGWTFVVNAAQKVIVSREHFQMKLDGTDKKSSELEKPTQPNLDALYG